MWCRVRDVPPFINTELRFKAQIEDTHDDKDEHSFEEDGTVWCGHAGA